MIKILIVDDNEQNQYLLKVLLEGNGYELALVNNGVEALKSARSDPPDLVISDILMPGMDGFALCREWKTDDHLKHIPFIFYTATYTDTKDEAFSLSLGAARFIRKPEEPAKFVKIVENVLDEYKAGKLPESNIPVEGEKIFYKEYNASLVHKLEDKLLELEKANQRISTLFQSSKELTYRIEAGLRAGNLAWWEMELPSGNVIFDNRKAELLGYPPNKFKKYTDFTKLLHPEDRQRTMQAMHDHLDGKADVYEVEYRLKTNDGNFKWFHDVGTIIEHDEETGRMRIIGIVDDISKRKEAEIALEAYSSQLEILVAERTKELERAQKELLAKEKLATLGHIAGSFGHELRNPLGVISNAVYVIKSNISNENQKVKEYSQIVNSQVLLASKIISDLLIFTSEPSANKTQINVSELVAQVINNNPASKNISIKTNIEPDLPCVFADRNHIEQALANLINNAFQAMPEGGSLNIHAAKKKNMLHITVQDSGIGINKKDMQKLFSPLYTTKARGIGLGLAISKKLVEANGGSIDAHSEAGQGSLFTIYLPISRADHA